MQKTLSTLKRITKNDPSIYYKLLFDSFDKLCSRNKKHFAAHFIQVLARADEALISELFDWCKVNCNFENILLKLANLQHLFNEKSDGEVKDEESKHYDMASSQLGKWLDASKVKLLEFMATITSPAYARPASPSLSLSQDFSPVEAQGLSRSLGGLISQAADGSQRPPASMPKLERELPSQKI